jgi:bifunctional DNA-binding transcriptional regulator/antitoxin component of YhaV-PrlF toxin-antitoxin module
MLAEGIAGLAQLQQSRSIAMPSGTSPGPGETLEGKALLDKARALSNRPEEQIARACGYVGPSGRVLRKSFYRALVEAKGFSVPSGSGNGRTPRAGGGLKGRQAEFRTRVHGNGNLLIGNAYTKKMGLEPGQEFRIELHPETRSIWLTPLQDSVVKAGTEAEQIQGAEQKTHAHQNADHAEQAGLAHAQDHHPQHQGHHPIQ